MTHKPQNRIMLRDIKSYIITKKYLRNMYYMRIIVRENLRAPHDEIWLINDFYDFLNKNHPLMHGYINEVYQFFKRRKNINTNKEVINYINKMDKEDISTQINVYLAMMNSYERKKFVKFCLALESY